MPYVSPLLCLLHRAAALHPILEAAKIAHVLEAEVLQRLAGEGGAAAEGAIENNGPARIERLVVIWRLRISLELEHAARDVQCAPDLAARLQFRRLAHIDDERARGLELGCFLRRDRGDDGVGCRDLFHDGCHCSVPPVTLRSARQYFIAARWPREADRPNRNARTPRACRMMLRSRGPRTGG